MTPIAITFLVLAAVVIWGGLITSIVLLRRDVPEGEMEPASGDVPGRAPRQQPRRASRANRRRT